MQIYNKKKVTYNVKKVGKLFGRVTIIYYLCNTRKDNIYI